MAQTIKLKRSATQGATPTTSQLELGEIAINTYDGKVFIKKNDGSDSIVEVTGGSSGTFATNINTFTYTATASQTTFSGSDDNAATLSYTVGAIQVFLNGVYLDASEYTASNGTSVVLGSGAAVNDILTIIAFTSDELVGVAQYDDTTANFTGTLQNGGSNVVVDSDIGSTVQAYDADTAKYDDTTANFTGTLQNGGSNVVVDSDIGSTVQAHDSNLTSFVSAFTLPTTDGTADQVLTTDGSGTLSFADASGGGGGGGGTLGTLTKTFAIAESATISLTSSVLAPLVSVTKEVAQTGVTNNYWDVSASLDQYVRTNDATATTLDFVGFDISTASYSQSLSVGTQDSAPTGIAFNNDGTKMFVVGDAGNDVSEYTLSTAFDISTAGFSGGASTTGETSPEDIAFNTDGTKMFIVGSSGDDVNEYTLSIAFDISTASYSQNFSVATEESSPVGIAFNNDGTKMFIVGSSGDDVNEYTLSTGFDVSTASYSQNFSVASQETIPQSIRFNRTGTKMFIIGNTNPDSVHEYTLSTAFDVSTASYSQSFETGSDTSMEGLAFNNDGTKMYLVGSATDYIYEYNLDRSAVVALGTGAQFSSADLGKTIEANGGKFVLTSIDGNYVETQAPTSYSQVASGDWGLYSIVYNSTDDDLELSGVTVNVADVSEIVYLEETSVFSSPTWLAFNNDGTKMFTGYSTTISEFALSTAFDVSSAASTATSTLSVSAQGTPDDIVFNNDGTKMFTVSNVNDTIYEYTLSTGFDLSTASYASVSLSTSSYATVPLSIAFNNDGTKMFTLDASGDLDMYTLSTAFDISTASHSSVTTLSGVGTSAVFTFNSDGTKIYVASNVEDKIYELSMTTAFDPSTISVSANTFDISSLEPSVKGIAVNNDDTKLYFCGQTNDKIYGYSLRKTLVPSGYRATVTSGSTDTTYWTDINSMTADQAAGFGSIYYALSTDDRTTWKVVNNGYDVSSASYSQSFSVNSQETLPRDIVFNTDGTKMFIVGATGDDVNEYTLSTAFDVSTASYSQNFSVGTQETNPTGIAFNNNGTKMYVVGYTGDDVNEYTLSTGFDVSTASYSQVFTLSPSTNPYSIRFNNDGTKMFILGDYLGSINVYEYALSTAFDVSTASYSQRIGVAGQDLYGFGLEFNDDGTKMFVTGNENDSVYEYNLTTGFDLSTASYFQSISIANQEASPSGIAFNSDGSKMFIVGFVGDDVNEYNLKGKGTRSIARNNSGTWEYNSNTSWGSETWVSASTNTEAAALEEGMINRYDMSAASYLRSFSVATEETGATGIAFNTNGTKMFIVGTTGDDVNEYTLSTAFDVSTASYSQNFSVATEEAGPYGIAFNTDGTKMFIVGSLGKEVNEYTLSTGFDVSTASSSQVFDVSTQDTSPTGIAFNTNGTKMFIVGASGSNVNEYTLSTGFDVSTASYSQNFSVVTAPRNIEFNNDGTEMFVVGGSANEVTKYTLSTAFDVSTASYSQAFSVATQDTSPVGLAFNNDGTKMFVVGGSNDAVYEYSTAGDSFNKMSKTQIDDLTDANQITLANDLDLAIIFYSSATVYGTPPSSNGVSVNYDGSLINEAAILGTDYTFNTPAQDKVRIRALTSGNYKIRVL